MIVIGAVLLVLAALAAIAAVVTGRNVQVHLNGFGVDSTTNVLWVFCAGAVAMLLLVLALAAFRRGARRRRAKRRELEARRAEELAAAEARGAAGGQVAPTDSPAAAGSSRSADSTTTVDSPPAVDSSRAVDVREPEGAHAYRGEGDDPGPERRYVPGEERVN